MEPVAYLDWRKPFLKQQQLDAAESAKSEKKQTGGRASPSDDSDSAPVAPSSPNKRMKSTPTATPSSSKRVVSASESALADIPVPDAKWIEKAREDMSIRAIKWIGNFMMKCPKENFAFSGGDIIFLLRNAIFKGEGEVAVSGTHKQQQQIEFSQNDAPLDVYSHVVAFLVSLFS